MKYLTSYKLFESASDDIDRYLQKMGATRDDINDIFISLIDQGYEVKYLLRYKDSIGRVRYNKTTNYEIPILKIELKNNTQRYVGGSTKFKDLNYIENLYHSLSRFSGMYKDNLEKITYELHTNAEMTINCYFEVEEDESIITIPLEDMANAIKQSIRKRFGHSYTLDVRNQSNKQAHFDIDILPGTDVDKLADKMLADLKKSGKDWATNYESARSAQNSILRVLESDLSKRFNMKIFFSNRLDAVWNRTGAIDGIYTHEWSPAPGEERGRVRLFGFDISPESNHYRFNIKKNIFKQRRVELEVYEKIEIKLRLV